MPNDNSAYIQVNPTRRKILDAFAVKLSVITNVPVKRTEAINCLIDSLEYIDEQIIVANHLQNCENKRNAEKAKGLQRAGKRK